MLYLEALGERSRHQHNLSTTLKYLWRYIFNADWSIRIRVGHINGEMQPLQQQADEKCIMFSCLTLLTMSEGNVWHQQPWFKLPHFVCKLYFIHVNMIEFYCTILYCTVGYCTVHRIYLSLLLNLTQKVHRF